MGVVAGGGDKVSRDGACLQFRKLRLDATAVKTPITIVSALRATLHSLAVIAIPPMQPTSTAPPPTRYPPPDNDFASPPRALPTNSPIFV